MPAADRLDASIARLAETAASAKELLTLAEAYDRLKHAGTGTQETVLASGADMLDASANFADEGDRVKRVGFRSQQAPRA